MIAATIIEWIYTQQAVVITSNRNHVSEVLAVTAVQTVIFLYLVCVLLYHVLALIVQFHWALKSLYTILHGSNDVCYQTFSIHPTL